MQKCIILVILLFASTFDLYAQVDPTRRPSSKEYDDLAVKAVNALVAGEAEAFEALLTKGIIERTESAYGKDAMERIVKDRFVPFFQDFEKLDPNVTTTKTKDGDGNEGIAFFRMFITKDGTEKPFVVYVIEEDAVRVKVANFLINKRFKDMNPKYAGGKK